MKNIICSYCGINYATTRLGGFPACESCYNGGKRIVLKGNIERSFSDLP